jgi:hypothetical protein
MRALTYLLWSQILLFGCIALAHAAPALFEGDEILELELSGPLKATLRDRRKPSERPFTIATTDGEWPVAVRTRGKSRTKLCSFPPLRLSFDADGILDGPFVGQHKVKLVTHCTDRAPGGDDLLEEFVAYRIFAFLSDYGHRVRLLRITYVDTEKKRHEPLVRYAFALEPIEQLADRSGASLLETEHLAKSRIDREQAALVFVFQYLIANLDWSLVKNREDDACCHNVHLVQREGRDYLIPYDFDLSGLVIPDYARRAPNVAQRPSRRRSYQGYCMDGLQLDQAVATVLARRDEIMTLVAGLPWTDAEALVERRAFFEKFFVEARAGDLGTRMAGDCIG